MTVWHTDEGAPYTALQEVYGRLVSSDSEAYRLLCQARYILELPRERRAPLMNKIAGKSCKRSDFATHEAHQEAFQKRRLALEQIVTREWKAQRGEAA